MVRPDEWWRRGLAAMSGGVEAWPNTLLFNHLFVNQMVGR
jgi:hypothetical protein